MSTIKNINDADALLLFSVGPVLCCAASVSVVSVMLPPVMHKPPGSDRNHPGVFRHSSGMVKVVDLRQRFGVGDADWRVPGRMIVTEISGGHAGFLVDDILDVTQWPKHGWGPLPALVPRNVFKRILLRNESIYLYADFENLFRCDENGYLRAHITQLVALQKPAIEIQKTLNTAPSQITSNAAEIIKSNVHDMTPAPVATTIDNNKTSLPIHPVSITKPIHVKTPGTATAGVATSTRPDVQKTNTALSRPTLPYAPELPRTTVNNQNKPGAEFTGRDKPAVVQESIQQGRDNQGTAGNNTEQMTHVAAPPSLTQTSWLSYSVPVILVMVLMAMMLVVLNLDTRNDPPEQQHVVEVNEYEQPLVNTINEEQPVLQANIEQDDEGLVITVDAEADEILDAEPLPARDSAAEPNREKKPVGILKAQPSEKIIVHIVVKGDTLWDIANLYVRDPWRYPELAKLSNIKNPHRIYPGNKVKIIKRIAGKKLHADPDKTAEQESGRVL